MVGNEHHLFHIPELLEAILIELPVKDLLLGQRVCKTWRGAIETSSRLQKALFFVPESSKRLELLPGKTIPAMRMCKLLLTAIDCRYFDADSGKRARPPKTNTLVEKIMLALATGMFSFDALGNASSWEVQFTARGFVETHAHHTTSNLRGEYLHADYWGWMAVFCSTDYCSTDSRRHLQRHNHRRRGGPPRS